MGTSRARRPAPSPPGRYTLPGAAEARKTLEAELRRHGYTRLADEYASGALREKGVMARLACASIELDAAGKAYDAKVARGVALLAAYLHEGKHERVASPAALQTFWAHYNRVHE